MPSRKRVLFLSPNIIAMDMAGVGMRHYEMARALAPEFDVTLAVPRIEGDPIPGVRTVEIGRGGSLQEMAAGADILVLQGDIFRRYPRFAPPTGVPIVVDMACPVLLEDLENRRGRRGGEGDEALLRETMEHEDLRRMVIHLLRIGDLVLCGGERQRDLIQGMLIAAGREPDSLVAVVPYGVPGEEPERMGPGPRTALPGVTAEDLLLFWGGGMWNWLDPEILVEAMARLRDRASIKLIFAGVRHPDPEFPTPEVTTRTLARAEEADLLGKTVHFLHWIPYLQRGSYLLESDIGVSAHRASVETRFAVRTRILDYLWAGLPVMTSAGDEAAEMVRREGLGIVVDPGDVEGWVDGILRLEADRDERMGMAGRSRALGRTLRWRKVIGPLAERMRRDP